MSESLKKEIAVLLFTDIVGSVSMQKELGTEAYTGVVARHDALMRRAFDLSSDPPVILKETGDGVLAKFRSASGAVEAALRIQYLLNTEPWEKGREVRVRIGIHLGEVTEMKEEITGETRAVGMAINLASRVMDLAEAGQILMTRSVFDDARQFLSKHPKVGEAVSLPALLWPAHGRYLFKGYDEPLDIFEVGAERIAPLSPPEGSGKAQRAVAADEEATLGWRPGAGLEIPRREDWVVVKKVGVGGFGEVWLAENETTREQRVFKFCFDPERLRSFKRELTLFRLLRDALGKRKDIAALYEVSVDEPPFYLESEYVPTGNLSLWAESQGGIDNVPMATRLKLLADAARAAGAAHSVGVIHKDLKPSNILVAEEDGQPQPRLADFGIGTLASNSQLEDLGITEVGFTMSIGVESGSHTSGTPLYTAPEYVVGAPPSVQGDIYALGVMLYQLVVGDLSKPLGSGWQRNIEDELLREDIDRCVDLEPARRFESACELAEHLETLDARREEKHSAEKQKRTAARRRRFVLLGGMGMLAMAVIVGLLAYAFVQEQRLEKEARVMASDLDFRIGGQMLDNDRSAEAVAHLARAIRNNPENISAARKLMATLAHRSFLSPRVGPFPIGGPGNRRYRYSVAVTPDASRMAVAYEDATRIGLWDLKTGKQVFENLDPEGSVWEMMFVDGGKKLVSNTLRELRVFDVTTGEVVRSESVAGGLLSEDGLRWIRVQSLEEIDLVDPATGKVLVTGLPPFPGVGKEFFFEPGGKWICGLFFERSGNVASRVLRVLEFEGGKVAKEWRLIASLPGIYNAPNYMYGSNDVTRVTVPEGDGSMKVWSIPDGELLQTLYKPGDQALAAEFSPDNEKLIIGYFGKRALIWDLETGRTVGAPLTHRGGVARIRFSKDGTRVATGSLDHSARLWDVATGNSLAEPLLHSDTVAYLEFADSGRRLITTSFDGYAWSWNMVGQSAGAESMLDGEQLLAVSRDGKLFAVTERIDGRHVVTVRDGSGLPVGKSRSGHNSAIGKARFSDDSRRLATFSHGGFLNVLDLEDDTSRGYRLSPPAGSIVLAISRTCESVLTTSGSNSKSAWLWTSDDSFTKPTVLDHESEVLTGSIDASGNRVAVVTVSTASLWERRENGKFTARTVSDLSYAISQGFTAEGDRLLVGRIDDTAQVRRFADGAAISAALPHVGPVVSIRHRETAGAEFLVTATAALNQQGHGTTIYLWDLAKEEQLTPPIHLVGSSNILFGSRRWIDLSLDDEATKVFAVSDNQAVFWDVSPEFSEQVPGWVAELGESLVGMRLDDRGKPKRIPHKEAAALRASVRTRWDEKEHGESLVRWAEWLIADRAKRTISPSSGVTREKQAVQHMRIGDSHVLRQALHVSPSEPALMAALAAKLLEEGEAPASLHWLLETAEAALSEPAGSGAGGSPVLRTQGLVALAKANAILGRKAEAVSDQRAGYLAALAWANRALQSPDLPEGDLNSLLTGAFIGLTTTLDSETESEKEEPLWLAAFLSAGDKPGRDRGRAFGKLIRIGEERGEIDRPIQLIKLGASWRLDDRGEDHGIAWREPAFDDASWKTGVAPLGFGDLDLNPVEGGDPKNRTPTIYFRKTIDIEDPTAINNLRVLLRRDDGAVVYLNGKEFWRNNMPAGEIKFETFAGSAISSQDETRLIEKNIGISPESNPFVAGANTVAIEIHQSDAGSSDLAFDFKLVANLIKADFYRRNLDQAAARKKLEEISDLVPSGVAGLLLSKLSKAGAE